MDEMRARLDHYGILINGLIEVVSKNFMGSNVAAAPTTGLRPTEAGPSQDTLLQDTIPPWPFTTSPYNREPPPGPVAGNEESRDLREIWPSSSTSVRMTTLEHDHGQLQVRVACDGNAQSGRGSRTAMELSSDTVQPRYGCTRSPSYLGIRSQVDPKSCQAIGSIGHRICQKDWTSLEISTIVPSTSSTLTMGRGDSRSTCRHSWRISTFAISYVRLIRVDRPPAPPITRRFYIVACSTSDPSSCAQSILH